MLLFTTATFLNDGHLATLIPTGSYRSGKQKKAPHGMLFGGRERIRTAVQGFADLCLATRPLDLLIN